MHNDGDRSPGGKGGGCGLTAEKIDRFCLGSGIGGFSGKRDRFPIEGLLLLVTEDVVAATLFVLTAQSCEDDFGRSERKAFSRRDKMSSWNKTTKTCLFVESGCWLALTKVANYGWQ